MDFLIGFLSGLCSASCKHFPRFVAVSFFLFVCGVHIFPLPDLAYSNWLMCLQLPRCQLHPSYSAKTNAHDPRFVSRMCVFVWCVGGEKHEEASQEFMCAGLGGG